MENISLIFLLLSFFLTPVFLIKPSLVKKLLKKEYTRKQIAIAGIAIFIISTSIFSVVVEPIDPPKEESNVSISDTNIVEDESINTDANEDKDEESLESAKIDEEQSQTEEGDKIESETTESKDQNNTDQREDSTGSVVVTVASVVDGDTVKLNIDGKVESMRLIGIDTPETVHPTKGVECFGKEASNYLKSTLTPGTKVHIEYDPSQSKRDKYNRLLGYILLENGTNINRLMISQGYAYEYTYNTPYKYQSSFKQAQADAKNNKRGLWADGVCDSFNESHKPSVDAKTEQPPQVNQQEDKETPSEISVYKWYVSSHHSSKYYYCETDQGWKGLSKTYLQIYNSESALKVDFPNHTLHQPC